MTSLTKKKLRITCLVLLIINLFLTVKFWKMNTRYYQHLDGTEVHGSSPEMLQTLLVGQLISFPLLSLLIGLIVALFIDKHLPYSRRIIPGFILTLTMVYGLLTVMGLSKALSFL